MSNSVKSKFAGLLRGLLRRVDREEAPVAPESHPVTATAPTEPAPSVVESSAPPALAKIASVPPNENEIAVPLAPIMASLPMDMRAKVVSVPPPGMTINLSVENVVSQLAFGAVRITFGELRQMTQGVFSNFTGDLDGKSINLPLNEILSRINPALLSRRSGSKVEVTDEISGPFGAGGNGVAFTSQPMKAPAPASPTRVPIATNLPPRGNAPVIPPAAAPAMPPSAPIAFRPPPGAGRFVQPTPLNGHSAPTTNGQNGHHGTNGNGNHNGNGHDNNPAKTNGANGTNGHHAPPTPPPVVPPAPKISAAPAPVPTPAPVAPVAPRPEPAQPTIYAAVWDLAENWPQILKDEISRSALANVNVPLSGNIVAAGLKRGRIMMTWKEIRSLAKPSSMPSPNDALELELPLKLIAPLFFAAQKNLPSARKATSVSSEIPNLFFGFPQATAPAPHPTPSAPPPAPVTPVAPVASVPPLAPPPTSAPLKAFVPIVPPASPLEKKEANSNFYVWGDNGEIPKLDSEYALPSVPNTDFTSRRATPKEVVARAMTLRGVAGAVVTLPDGLRVASEVPAEFNADTLAAFIPQIFERMNQSARELRMGSLNNISFTVGNVPWRIIRVNAVYLAAFGRAGVSLPAAELTELAEELDRKKS